MDSPDTPSSLMVPTSIAAGGLGLSLLAEITSSGNAGVAGVILALTSLLACGFQYFKAILDSRQQAKENVRQARRIDQLETDLAGSRHRRHEDANRYNAILMEYRVEIVSLKSRLGIMDKTHVEAININADDTEFLADRTGVRLPKKPPHIEPMEEDEPEYDRHGNRLKHEPPSDL